ncbi:PEP-CTERM sorting domain-containing protein [Roseateles depolymerans]|nr:PEP-CTERM sorting domain-containing protein [Roseateles depolymerans]
MITRTAQAVSLLALAAGLSTPAFAALTGDYGTSHWTTTNTAGGNGTVVATPDRVEMTSADFSLVDALPVESWLSHAITVTQDTQLSFDWHYRTDDMSSSFDVFGYTVNGVFTQLSQDGLSFLDLQGGHQSLRVSAGSTFAWSLRSQDSEGGAAVVTLDGLSAVAAVPEPSSYALMALGLGLLGWRGRRARRGS